MPHALHQDIVAPSGVEFSVSLSLTAANSFAHLVVANASVLKVFQVRQQPAYLRAEPPGTANDSRDEMDMETEGDGFLNVGELKSQTRGELTARPMETRMILLREHHVHGIVTGLQKVRTMASNEDGMDRLLVTFKDAKISLMEWSDAVYDLVTVSIHTYERATQFASPEALGFKSYLRVDPASRCAAVALPGDSMAILPFVQSLAELDMLDQEYTFMKDAPYSPSFILDLPQEVDSCIKHVVDFIFLPGFSNITLAILYQTNQTCTGRLSEQKDTVSLSIITLDYFTHNYPTISRVERLPYDSARLLSCPSLYGGVMIQTSNAILHIDQASRITALPVNGWASRTSALPALQSSTDEGKLRASMMGLTLEGACMIFVNDHNLLLVLADGNIHVINVAVDGRTVSKLNIGDAIARVSPPTSFELLPEDHIFAGSTSGPSLLLRSSWHQLKNEDTTMKDVIKEDYDLDEDLYGDSAYPVQKNAAASGPRSNSDTAQALQLKPTSALPSWGTIADMTMSINVDNDCGFVEAVACTGVEGTASLTRFQNHIPTCSRRSISKIGGNRGLWSLAVRRKMNIDGLRLEQPAHLSHSDSILVASHDAPSTGMTKVFMVDDVDGDPKQIWGTPSITLVAASFFQRTCILIVAGDSIVLLSSGGKECQVVKETDLISASISDPYILVQRKDGSCALYAGDTTGGTINETPIYSTTNCALSCLFRDQTGSWTSSLPTSGTVTGNSINLEDVLNGEDATQWIVILRIGGIFEIISLPSQQVVFSSRQLCNLDLAVLNEGNDLVNFENGDVDPSAEILRLTVGPIGQRNSSPHILMLTRTNVLLAYETVPHSSGLSSTLQSKFIKRLARPLSPQAASSSQVARDFVTFTVLNDDGESYSGVFCSGVRPFWLLSQDNSALRLYPSGHSAVYGFTATSAFRSEREFLTHTGETVQIEQWAPHLRLDAELPYNSVRTQRPYSAITFDANSGHLVAASVLHRKFALFDDELQQVWTPEDSTISLPLARMSCVEIISPHTWETLDGFEFPEYEYVTCLECVPLESKSTEAGMRNFIVASTAVDRGEDLSVRGGVYVFEIVEVVPEGEDERGYRLKLRCKDDAKGPVTALCGMNGYLVSSMGQKIYVRAFELDERLVGVAFLDVGVYVTSIRALKNLLLIGDERQGTCFVGFQEDPFKLVILSKGRQTCGVSNADFFFGFDGQLSFLVCGDDGSIRAFEFNPHHPDSQNGQLLTLRTEYHAHSDHHVSLTIGRRKEEEDHEDATWAVSAQSILLYCTIGGGLSQVSVVSDTAFKRLSLLQGQLVRNVQHVAGLNPRAHRTVRNDTISRPLTKGILDGNLLWAFTQLDARRQGEITRQIGTHRAVILRDLGIYSDTW